MITLLDRITGSFSPDIGIDLGTVSTPVLESGSGITVREFSCVAYNRAKGTVAAVGDRAKMMDGRAPLHIEIVRPLKDGVIADFEAAEAMIRYLLSKTKRKGVLGPRIMVGVPVGATEVECRAVSEATRSAGARCVYVVPQPLAAAVGAGMEVLDAKGSMIVDIGGGTAQAAVISMGGIIVSDCIKVAGDRLDEKIIKYMREQHNLLVGKIAAESLKITCGSAINVDPPLSTEIRGRHAYTGLPKKVSVNSNQLCSVFAEDLQAIADLVKRVLEATPPELAADIVSGGFALSGGVSLLHGIDTFLSKQTGIYCYKVPDPLSSAAMGLDIMFKDSRLMRTVFNCNLSSLLLSTT